MTCSQCGDSLDAESFVECPECLHIFCDDCYDTGKGDGCQCHAATIPEVAAKVTDAIASLCLAATPGEQAIGILLHQAVSGQTPEQALETLRDTIKQMQNALRHVETVWLYAAGE